MFCFSHFSRRIFAGADIRRINALEAYFTRAFGANGEGTFVYRTQKTFLATVRFHRTTGFACFGCLFCPAFTTKHLYNIHIYYNTYIIHK